MNMIISELVIAGYGIPVDFTASYMRGWKLGKPLCQATGFILTTSGTYVHQEIKGENNVRGQSQHYLSLAIL